MGKKVRQGYAGKANFNLYLPLSHTISHEIMLFDSDVHSTTALSEFSCSDQLREKCDF